MRSQQGSGPKAGTAAPAGRQRQAFAPGRTSSTPGTCRSHERRATSGAILPCVGSPGEEPPGDAVLLVPSAPHGRLRPPRLLVLPGRKAAGASESGLG